MAKLVSGPSKLIPKKLSAIWMRTSSNVVISKS